MRQNVYNGLRESVAGANSFSNAVQSDTKVAGVGHQAETPCEEASDNVVEHGKQELEAALKKTQNCFAASAHGFKRLIAIRVVTKTAKTILDETNFFEQVVAEGEKRPQLGLLLIAKL